MTDQQLSEAVARKLNPPADGTYDDETTQRRRTFEGGIEMFSMPRNNIGKSSARMPNYYLPWGSYRLLP